jgi:hypothetical protein
MWRPLTLGAVLLLMGGCQAQPVRPDFVAPVQAQPELAEVLGKRFDESLGRFDQVEHRITLVQEQLDKQRTQLQNLEQLALNQRQLLEQRNAQDQAQQQPSPEQQALTNLVYPLERLLSELQGSVASGGGTTDYASYSDEFQLVSTYTLKGQWVIFKYHEGTGLTWIADRGEWIEIEERETPPASRYQVILKAATGDIKGYVAARVDRASGDIWWLKGTQWLPFNEAP